ncbi:hypothetical protein TcasGA2_TC032447 [Tribolium castaneum]|uniref:Uncharacterized protein n=1 Tax=Tribolium castaneum TaxID=7070 RepID=A0A139WLE6_TRICA|nr:hypothetical protein TcasGA2_TC032447 [Tribolium castaneum]
MQIPSPIMVASLPPPEITISYHIAARPWPPRDNELASVFTEGGYFGNRSGNGGSRPVGEKIGRKFKLGLKSIYGLVVSGRVHVFDAWPFHLKGAKFKEGNEGSQGLPQTDQWLTYGLSTLKLQDKANGESGESVVQQEVVVAAGQDATDAASVPTHSCTGFRRLE